MRPFAFASVAGAGTSTRNNRRRPWIGIMPFAYYAKLSPSSQRTYRQSDAIQSRKLPAACSCVM